MIIMSVIRDSDVVGMTTGAVKYNYIIKSSRPFEEAAETFEPSSHFPFSVPNSPTAGFDWRSSTAIRPKPTY